MSRYTREAMAERCGVGVEELDRLTGLDLLGGSAHDGYTEGDVRRVQVIQELEEIGLDADRIATLVRRGRLQLDFIDQAGVNVIGGLSASTFAELSAETGVPVEMLTVLREITGGVAAHANDRVRDNELGIVPLVAYQHQIGFSRQAIERALRVYGDALRRIAEAEAEWWRSEVQEPMLASGQTADDVGRRAMEISPRLSELVDRAVLAVFHAQQRHVWLTNIAAGIEAGLEQAGLHVRQQTLPAMCFLDLAGYTELTAQRGDAAAAGVVERVRRIVDPIAVEHGGRAVKWLGDGVMFHFPEPARGADAAMTMVDALAAANLPPAHVGLHAGPIVVQEGDYYGQTVNLAARIGEYARPGEVLVSRSVVEAGTRLAHRFEPVGAVRLKGVADLVELFAARPEP